MTAYQDNDENIQKLRSMLSNENLGQTIPATKKMEQVDESC